MSWVNRVTVLCYRHVWVQITVLIKSWVSWQLDLFLLPQRTQPSTLRNAEDVISSQIYSFLSWSKGPALLFYLTLSFGTQIAMVLGVPIMELLRCSYQSATGGGYISDIMVPSPFYCALWISENLCQLVLRVFPGGKGCATCSHSR